jgi:hypothetical protein
VEYLIAPRKHLLRRRGKGRSPRRSWIRRNLRLRSRLKDVNGSDKSSRRRIA